MEDGLIKKLRSVLKRTNYHYHLDGNGVLPGGDVKFHHLLADVIKLCKALYLDFAAIDVVKSDEDKYYIIDVNLTPNWNMDKYPEMLSFLSDGLYQ